jgi:hypothetical protein
MANPSREFFANGDPKTNDIRYVSQFQYKKFNNAC